MLRTLSPPQAIPTAHAPAVSVRGLQVRYGDVEAVRGIDLDVRRGEILALLGPNGAGKTSTIEVLEGFRRATPASVAVLGADPSHAAREWRDRIGIVLQESAPSPGSRSRVPRLYAGYYPSRATSTRRSRSSGSTEQADAAAAKLSGGQRRRLDVALRWSATPSCSSSTSRRPASTPRRAARRGR